MSTKKIISTAMQIMGATILIGGISLYSTRLAVLCGGVILTLFGIALERDA
jgi:hypothetical protein